MDKYVIEKDVVIIGGGIPGIVHAIQSARLGMKVALINDRGYLGGNGSAEIGVCVSGATGTQEFNFFARETGVLEELLLENLHRNPDGNRYIWDGVLTEAVLSEENIELFANTYVDSVETDGNKIISVSGSQNTTEKRFVFKAPVFADNTGDGTVAYLAGANYRYGRESKEEFGERIAPDKADNHVLPSTLAFFAKDMGHKVAYTPPKFALDLSKTDVLKYRIIPKKDFAHSMWFYEIDGDIDQINEAEKIIQDHRELVYGIWDHIKNSGEYDADNYDLEYVSPIMGKRESRRIMGDHILTESDIVEQRDFEDTVGHGGWSIDLHAIRGFYATEPINRHIIIKGIYQIPYRCGYSENIDNLFVEGRCMSTSHVAFGTTRVMATLATVGQANAVASYLCKKYDTTPRGVYKNHLEELQQTLLKYDQYIVGKEYNDDKNLAKDAKVTVSSVKGLKITEQDGKIQLNKDLSISIPVKKKMESIKVLLNVKEDTVLKYKISSPVKGESYNPEILLCEKEISLKKTDGFTWITLPLNVEIEKGRNLFFELTTNENIWCATSEKGLPGVVCSYHEYIDSVVIIDIDTLDKKKDQWYRLHKNICFEAGTDEEIYSGENLINGYARPYGGANIWASKQIEGEYFTLKLSEKKILNEMVLIFDSDLDELCHSTNDGGMKKAQGLVKDYDVLCKNKNGEFVNVMEVRDNYQRVNTLDLEGVETDEVKVVFHETYGQDFVGVYSARLYS